MTPAYPASLPAPITFGMVPDSQLIITDANDFGPIASRSVTRQASGRCTVTFRFLESDYKVFKAWWINDLLYGLRWFTINLPSARGNAPHIAKFLSKIKVSKRGYRLMELTADLELRDRRQDPPPPPPADPLASLVVLRLDFEGDEILDTSLYEATMTVEGGAAITTARAKFGSGSLRIGASGKVKSPVHPRYRVTGDFSISCWAWPTTSPSFERLFGSNAGPSSELAFIGGSAYVIWRGNVRFIVADFFTGTSGWVHVYLSMVDDVLTLYRNGSNMGQWTNTAGYPSNSNDDMCAGSGADGLQPWLGDLDQFEYIIGAARWTEPFTPPTEPLP